MEKRRERETKKTERWRDGKKIRDGDRKTKSLKDKETGKQRYGETLRRKG